MFRGPGGARPRAGDLGEPRARLRRVRPRALAARRPRRAGHRRAGPRPSTVAGEGAGRRPHRREAPRRPRHARRVQGARRTASRSRARLRQPHPARPRARLVGRRDRLGARPRPAGSSSAATSGSTTRRCSRSRLDSRVTPTTSRPACSAGFTLAWTEARPVTCARCRCPVAARDRPGRARAADAGRDRQGAPPAARRGAARRRGRSTPAGPPCCRRADPATPTCSSTRPRTGCTSTTGRRPCRDRQPSSRKLRAAGMPGRGLRCRSDASSPSPVGRARRVIVHGPRGLSRCTPSRSTRRCRGAVPTPERALSRTADVRAAAVQHGAAIATRTRLARSGSTSLPGVTMSSHQTPPGRCSSPPLAALRRFRGACTTRVDVLPDGAPARVHRCVHPRSRKESE